MEIHEKIIPEKLYISKVFDEYMGHLNCVFLDIETTGINPEINKVILVGLIIIKNNALTSKQLFAEKKEDEKHLLSRLSEILDESDIIINYNGNSFDIPFLNKRFEKNGIFFSIPKHVSFDLYRIIKNYGYVKLNDYKLKTIEKFLGINRTDTISGKDSITLYNKYLNTKNPIYKEKICLHNYEDIYSLTKVLPIINKYDFHKITFENPRYLKTDKGHQKTIVKENIIKKERLIVNGLCHSKKKDNAFFTYSYDYKFSSKAKEFSLQIPLYKKNDLLYLSLKDFDFIYEKRMPLPHIPPHILTVKENGAINYMEINWFINDLISHLHSY